MGSGRREMGYSRDSEGATRVRPTLTDDRGTHRGEEGAALREATPTQLAVDWGRGSSFDGWSHEYRLVKSGGS